MASRVLIALLLVLLPALPAMAQNADPLAEGLDEWMNIPTFTVEAALGRGVNDDGDLTDEASTFPADVGVVFCRVAMIDSDRPQSLAVVWYREDEEVARQKMRLTSEQSSGAVSLKIPAARAGSWRVEVVGEGDQLLTVLPFVVGKASAAGETPPKKKTQP